MSTDALSLPDPASLPDDPALSATGAATARSAAHQGRPHREARTTHGLAGAADVRSQPRETRPAAVGAVRRLGGGGRSGGDRGIVRLQTGDRRHGRRTDEEERAWAAAETGSFEAHRR